MRPSVFLNAKSGGEEKKSVLLSAGPAFDQIEFLGASVPASVSPGSKVSFLTLGNVVSTDEDGVVAIVLHTERGSGKNSQRHSVPFFLSVSQKDGQPYIDLEEYWVSSADRPGQIVCEYGYESWLEVRINGEVFSTRDPINKYEPAKLRHVNRYVPDVNLLCKYLAGDVGAEEVKEAAERGDAEVAAKLKPPVDEEKEKLSALFEEAKRTASQLRYELGLHTEHEARMAEALQKANAERDGWRHLACHLADAVDKQWVKSPAVFAALTAVRAR